MVLIIFLQAASAGSMLPYLLAMFAIMYFFMIRPQMQRQKKEKAYRIALKKGDKVITTSGIHGKIIDFIEKDNTCIIETTAGRIKFERSAISMELSKKFAKPVVKK
ncbi:MAG: preprotein translocase subunit YajC [Flavobacteriaceae bacterium]|nr:preprotein translocase subunit YajC [Flavobacteriaceae bacterium]